MKKKIIIGVGIAFVAIASISIGVNINKIDENVLKENVDIISQDNSYDTYTYITENMRQKAENRGFIASYLNAYTPEYMLNESDAVALVTVVSLDNASTKESVFGMTYGKMLINDVFYGDVTSGTLVEYAKSGGLVSVADYDKYDIPESVAKRDYLREKAGITIDKENSYLRLKKSEDIEIEEGKTYLAYLNYIEEFDRYEIIGLGFGLREVNVDQVSKVRHQNYNINDLKIKNNETGEWESLENYVNQNIPNLENN